MTAATIYAHIVAALVALGYDQWRTTMSFREVPEALADGLFQVIPVSTDPQVAFIGSGFIDTGRKWRVSVLFRVAGSVPDIVEDRVLPAEEAITDALLALEETESVSSAYSDVDDAGGIIQLSLEVSTRYDRAV